MNEIEQKNLEAVTNHNTDQTCSKTKIITKVTKHSKRTTTKRLCKHLISMSVIHQDQKSKAELMQWLPSNLKLGIVEFV